MSYRRNVDRVLLQLALIIGAGLTEIGVSAFQHLSTRRGEVGRKSSIRNQYPGLIGSTRTSMNSFDNRNKFCVGSKCTKSTRRVFLDTLEIGATFRGGISGKCKNLQFQHRRSALCGNTSDNDGNSNGKKVGGKNRRSMRRAGGRARSLVSNKRRKQETRIIDDEPSKRKMGLPKMVLPILLGLFIVKNLLGFVRIGGEANNNFVYYQSSVYESTTYNEDGQMERIRKESFRSNVPSLISGDRTNQFKQDGRTVDDSVERIMREIERDVGSLDQDLSILDDF